jgi:hypothetical protein
MFTMVLGFEPLALRHAVCELETVTGGDSRKHQKARYLAVFFAFWGSRNSDWEARCRRQIRQFSLTAIWQVTSGWLESIRSVSAGYRPPRVPSQYHRYTWQTL